MNRTITPLILALVFPGLIFLYFYSDFNFGEVDKTFLTLSTFLFTIFAGFFISRQGNRYSDIRRLVATFDGDMSSVYRAFGHFGAENHKKSGEIITAHYKAIIDNKQWDYNFVNKSNTLTSLQQLLEDSVKNSGTDGVKGYAANRIMMTLHDTQQIRKNMEALREERVPNFQWILIYIITGILFVTVSVLPSFQMLTGSLIKAAFITSIFVALILLKRLDSLQFFEGIIGEHSAKDVLDIIEDKK